MAFSFIFRTWKSRFVSKRRPERRGHKPTVEMLEDRQAPAVFTVTSTADAGAGSLRQAILNANTAVGADTINFNIAGAGLKTINLASALPNLNGQTTIAGHTQSVLSPHR